LEDKKELWHKRVFNKLWLKNYKVAHIGACNDKLFAVAGVNQVRAVNQINGDILWHKDSSAVFSSTPICDGNLVYIISNDNKTFALNQESGEIEWIHYGIAKSLSIFGNALPVVVGDILITSYSSGEIYALDKKTGFALWSNDLNSYKSFNSDFFLSDIDATPLIKDNVVYAVSNSGIMKAINLKNGYDLWQKPISSVIDFWLAQDFLYIINNDNQLMAVYKKTGSVKWLVQLPKFKNPKKITSKYNYIGVIMAGDKLIIAREDGAIMVASPFDGKIEKTFFLNKKVLHVPIIIENKIYFYGMNRIKTKLIELE
jgi:outer membrane protein assembly factor BamB